MHYVDPSPETLLQTPRRTSPGVASHHGAQRKRPDHREISCKRALEITRFERIETTSCTKRLLWAGMLIRMSVVRLPKRMVFGNLEGVMRRGRDGKAKEEIDCVQSDVRAHGISEDWKAVGLEAGV